MKLIRPLRAGDEVEEPEKLLARYGVTGAFVELRLCERFGQDPLAWPERYAAAPRGLQLILAEYELVREQQEAEERAHGVG